MIYFPPLRRLLLPSLLCLVFILYYKSTVRIPSTREQLARLIVRQPELSPEGEHVFAGAVQLSQLVPHNVTDNFKSPPIETYYDYASVNKDIPSIYADPASNPHMAPLFQCPRQPNPHTGHIRLPYPLYNISLVVKNETDNERKGYLNPAIISLPYWSQNQYILVSRVATDGSHQQNLLCEANICHMGGLENAGEGDKVCSEEDIELFEGKGTIGMRCATPPITLNVPPTPAEDCGKDAGVLMDIPGFHDPRIFWSGKGEPLMMVNSQSRYACFGLWVIDLRQLHPSLAFLLANGPNQHRDGTMKLGPIMSYFSLTEITRNPLHVRGPIEKNWAFFGGDSMDHGTYVHYDMGPQKRSFAKLIGGGISTINLTDSREIPCLEDAFNPNKDASWHQGTNSLKLVLCDRSDPNCKKTPQNSVYFSLIHHKHKSMYSLPLRYERYFIVWAAEPPFSMLGVSSHPILMYNETAEGFDPELNWDGDAEQEALLDAGDYGKDNWAQFTYTVSISWAWRRLDDGVKDKNVGYLDDHIILGVGIDDESMNFARVPARELLACLRACPGRAPLPLDTGKPQDIKPLIQSSRLLRNKTKTTEEEKPKEEKEDMVEVIVEVDAEEPVVEMVSPEAELDDAQIEYIEDTVAQMSVHAEDIAREQASIDASIAADFTGMPGPQVTELLQDTTTTTTAAKEALKEIGKDEAKEPVKEGVDYTYPGRQPVASPLARVLGPAVPADAQTVTGTSTTDAARAKIPQATSAADDW